MNDMVDGDLFFVRLCDKAEAGLFCVRQPGADL